MTGSTALQRSDVRKLVATGSLDSRSYLGALGLFRDEGRWDSWVFKALFALGVGHILAGVICFFAFNWADLSDAMKFGTVQGGLVLSVILWIALRLTSVPAQAFGIAATVLTGVLLAVFGQVYQTPAAIYTPFILWAFLTLPFALASKSVAHWAVWLAIAVTAAITYIEDGIEPLWGGSAADWGFLVLAAILMGISALYHHLSRTRMLWARTSWFRLAVLLTGLCIAASLFLTLFWDLENTPVWVGALALVGGALFVIYRFWPSLPALILTSFTVIVMAAQLGLKAIVEAVPGHGDDIGQIFLIFLWMALTTFVLAKTFQFFQSKFGRSSEGGGDEVSFAAQDLDVTYSDIANVTGLGAEAISTAFAIEDDSDTPWYIDALIGLSGVLTAVFALLFLGVFLSLLIPKADTVLYIALGMVTWGISLFARLRADTRFARHFLNTLVLAGGGLFLGAMGLEFDGNLIFILVSMIAMTFTMWRVHDRILGFLMGAGFASILLYCLAHYDVPLPYVWLCIILTGLAVTGLAKPIGGRLYDAAGTACLIALPLSGAVLDNPDMFGNAAMPGTWLGVIASLACTGGAVFALNRMMITGSAFRPPLFVLAPLLLAVAIMPLGAAAALLIVLIAYILGSRTLAIIGVISQIYFVNMFYYDLQISLLNKSIMLTLSGIILVLIWVFIRKKESAHA